MVVRIRLARWGQRNRAYFRIVAADARAKRDGRFIEHLGGYNPLHNSRHELNNKVKRVHLNVDRIKYWISVGAQPTETVARLLGTAGVLPFSPRSIRAKEAQANAAAPKSFHTRSSLRSPGLSVAIGTPKPTVSPHIFVRGVVR